MCFPNVLKTLLAISLAVSGISATKKISKKRIPIPTPPLMILATNSQTTSTTLSAITIAMHTGFHSQRKKTTESSKSARTWVNAVFPKTKKQGLKDHVRFWLFDNRIPSHHLPVFVLFFSSRTRASSMLPMMVNETKMRIIWSISEALPISHGPNGFILRKGFSFSLPVRRYVKYALEHLESLR